MDRELKLRAFEGLSFTPVVLGGLIFIPAWTLNYWQGWLFIIVLTVTTLLFSLYVMKHDPALLERRMRAGPAAEKRPVQRIIMVCVTVAFCLLMIVSALDYRMGWSHLPDLYVWIGNLMLVLSYVGFHFVCKENSFASATIELAEDQKVISTGPYGIVRHPMYSSALIMTLGIPLALGSAWAELIVATILPILIWRIVDEEKFLAESLNGYTDYCKKVKYRLIPGLY